MPRTVRDVVVTSHIPMPAGGYPGVVRRIREVVTAALPAGTVVIVVSKGDERLVDFEHAEGWHFPRADDGSYAGYHPASSEAAITHLEELRAKGGQYLLFPCTAFWWFGHYGEFASYLERYRVVVRRRDDACVVFSLSEPAVEEGNLPDAARPARQRLGRHLEALVRHLLPPAAVVAVVSEGEEDFVTIDGVQCWPFPRTETGVHAGFMPVDGAAAIAELERIRADGAQFFLVPHTAFLWLERYPELSEYLRRDHQLVAHQEHVCEIFELSSPEGQIA